MEKIKASVLVVDDDEEMLEFCVLALEGLVSKIFPAGSSAMARQTFNSARCDLMLADINIDSTGDGISLAREFKNRFPEIPVVIMTGDPSLETAVAGFKSGICEYIIKPFSDDYLQSVIRNCLEKTGLSTQLAREREMKAELEAAYSQLKDSEKAKDAFLARVNHELRTPLSVAITSSEVICAELKKTGNLEIWKKLDGSLRDLHSIIEELLLYSDLREEGRKLQTRETDLWSLLSAAREGLKDLCAETCVKVELVKEGTEFNLAVDGTLIGEALRQLMLNAVRFNKKGGKVFVLVRYSPQGISFVFSDTGIGMSPGAMSGLFTPFYQAAYYLNREVGGVGLGLAMVKKIALLHDGDILAQINPAGGMIFTLAIPVKR
ncbi:MAG: hypothetical protein A2021_03940 [Elusimicrobia bacterium GWF2_52_66]|nr:MAG: hypothetical protein A2X33_10230 [Elusimicrobia bacterium GWA2_51_34]OGR84737.1 MAG: hypothetical protein A2021_03940 [Elusimicrobia bacterium GWF2_52_66]HAF94882.1 hypothetical protein [Elusimicrobiota bacterium]